MATLVYKRREVEHLLNASDEVAGSMVRDFMWRLIVDADNARDMPDGRLTSDHLS